MTTKGLAQQYVERLLDEGLTHDQISEALEGRVSARTIYRWASGETVPQNTRTFEALRALVESKEATPATP